MVAAAAQARQTLRLPRDQAGAVPDSVGEVGLSGNGCPAAAMVVARGIRGSVEAEGETVALRVVGSSATGGPLPPPPKSAPPAYALSAGAGCSAPAAAVAGRSPRSAASAA